MARRRRHLAPQARKDIFAIRRWFTQPGSGPRAQKRLEAVTNALRALVIHPCRYPVGKHPGVREWPVEGHRIMYELDPDTGSDETAGDVTVLRVFGPGQEQNL